MGSVKAEYVRFLEYLADKEVADDVRRLSFLILDHLKPLGDVGTARRGRSARLVPLAVQHLTQTPTHRDVVPDADAVDAPVHRLQQLRVGPFRGFMREETFDLSRDITLIYGANGTGKSSFFEALEVAMLDSIAEAQIKRLDQRIYCTNARNGQHANPVLSATHVGALEVTAVTPNEGEYRFCFIEKNRLDDFARIAARTPGDQRLLIATLFGVDQFSDFVKGFNPSLDQDLMLVGVKAAELTQRREQLAASEQIVATHPDRVKRVEDMEHAAASTMSPDQPFSVCVDWLLGTPQRQGRLAWVRAQLDTIPPPVHNVTPGALDALLTEAYRLHANWDAATRELAARAGDVSYAKLYEAVLALADGANACPACGTNLAAVTEDPFARARYGLEQLAQLATLQQNETTARNDLTEGLRRLWEEMSRVLGIAAQVCGEDLQREGLPQLPVSLVGSWLEPWVANDRRAWQGLIRIASTIERIDQATRMAFAGRAALADERGRLDEHRLEIERLRTMRSTLDEELRQAQQTVLDFNAANEELVNAVPAEVPLVALHARVKAAYDGFLPVLQGYLAALPGQLLQGLGQRACDLYNAFNRADKPQDLLEALWLPVAENGKIEITFAGEPGRRYDALLVLSEGHIKCLGLAILLAKNIEQKCPLVIFDDVVNAIDDEHRDGIWRTFFDDGLLDGKQIILTSHAEEFLHRIQQELGAQRAAAIKRYTFLPHDGEHELNVDSHPPIKNYVLLSQQALATEQKREALRQARPALESLTDRFWTWLGRRGDGRIDIKLGGPRSPWELNNKCTKLRQAAQAIQGQHAELPGVVAALNSLLGVNSGSIEWGYLNSGVHDAQRDHEFDRATVRVIVEAVTALDMALARLANR